MIAKLKICSGCKRPRHIWKTFREDGEKIMLCINCCFKRMPKKVRLWPTWTKEKRQKVKQEQKKYPGLAQQFKIDNPVCQFKGCAAPTVDVHHVAGRGIRLNWIKYWMANCRYHHTWIHQHEKEAEEMGYFIPFSKRKNLTP